MSLTLEHLTLVINARRSFKCVRMLLDKTEIHPVRAIFNLFLICIFATLVPP
jgi:hypothetical protein